jgi:hypothetical protein
LSIGPLGFGGKPFGFDYFQIHNPAGNADQELADFLFHGFPAASRAACSFG